MRFYTVQNIFFCTFYRSIFAVLCLMLILMGNTTTTQAASGPTQFHELWMQSSADDFATWQFNGTALSSKEPEVSLASGTNLTCAASDIDGGKASFDPKSRLCTGKDPYSKGQYEQQNYYNGGSFYYGTLVSPIHTTGQPVQTIVPSWNALTPPGTWLQLHLRVQLNKQWTGWYKMPIWASDFSAIKRHSINGQADKSGRVDTDAFSTVAGRATAYQLRLTLFSTTATTSPTIHRVAALASADANNYPQIAPDKSVWGSELPVPQRSQMLPEYRGLAYGGGGEVWCSPTSTSMIMAYWAKRLNRPQLDQKVPDAARDTYDFTYDGTGNWPFNTAYAATYGLTTFVTRLYTMSQVEQWIKAGIPLVIGLAYSDGELPGAPVQSSNGHLMVVRGFTTNGDVIANDPAGVTNQATRIIYKRAAIEKAWQQSSRGIAYIIMPKDWNMPTTHRHTNW